MAAHRADTSPSYTPIALPPNQVHLWYATVPQHDDAVIDPRYLALMSEKERHQNGRFFFERDRRRHAVTRALVRTVLSRYAPIEPSAWAFVEGQYGRPEIANAHASASRLCFNLSHTSDLVVLALSAGRSLGIDTESTLREAPLEVADRFFSASESAALRALPPAAQPLRFWELWTLKESYIKARGMGLSLPLGQFSFQLDEPASVAFSCEPGVDDAPGRWLFCQFRAESQHLLALCVDRVDGADIELVLHCVQPLGAEHPAEGAMHRCSPGGPRFRPEPRKLG